MRLKEIDFNFKRGLKDWKRDYRRVKLKVFLLFVLPGFIVALMIRVCRQFLWIKLKDILDKG